MYTRSVYAIGGTSRLGLGFGGSVFCFNELRVLGVIYDYIGVHGVIGLRVRGSGFRILGCRASFMDS